MLDEMVGAIMTRNVVTCTERETINDVMGRMTRGRFRHLPVAAGGRLTGIVSIGDVVKARLEEVQREADEMRTYIATA
jgi:CBS domain-containing protein